ncbi:MAG: tRNA uridine-5-carboxymethylaminomethyl(34) synthesis enzyme MnmG [Planctomycetota bacterium]
MRDFDVLVIGGGHAGAEAALAAARLGARTACVVLDPAAIGRMSCNPAIGGIAKGQLVREIDALGGEMGLVADASGIQFRMLNTKKGPAVRSPRAQCDRHVYNREMAGRVASQAGLTVVAGEATDLLVRPTGAGVDGVRLRDGVCLRAPAVVLTTGTFLGGRLFAGAWEVDGGRHGEGAATALSASLRSHGLRLARLKTGTPARLRRASIDFARLPEQWGDDPPRPFSFRSRSLPLPQVCCHVTHTTATTHAIIRQHAHLSPMVQGRIQGVGPRYCPSVEDKVVRFPDKDEHLVFLEPEGLDTEEVYPNGLSTSLPPEVQENFLRTLPGLEEVEVLRHGYAVEYDHLQTDQLRADLHVATLRGLFAAGQINGTSGYEEAAGQGIVAGINAARFVRGEPPFLLDRASSYLGVMVDDLCRVNPREPYRMFTSRAEFRLQLRADNADRRLAPYARELGLLDEQALAVVRTKEARIAAASRVLDTVRHGGRTLRELLRRPDVDVATLAAQHHELAALGLSPEESSEVEAEVKYEGYVQRQAVDVERLRRMEARAIPPDFDFAGIEGLSHEAREVLRRRAPLTLGEASRLCGVTPADLNLLLVLLARRARVG